MKLRNGRTAALAGVLYLVPILHPFLQPFIGDPSNLLWFAHNLAVALVVFNLGYRALAPAVLLSGLTVFVGETLFGQGYGVGASSETALILAGAVALTDLLVGWFAVYARGGRQRYLNLFEHANDAIFVHDPRGRIREVNPRAAELLGYSTDELLGMTVADLVAPDARHTFPESVKKVMEGTQVRLESRFQRKNGETFPVRVWATRFQLAGRTLIQGIAQDISELERDRRVHALLAKAIEQTAESVHITDVNGVVEYVNPAFERLTGFTEAEAVGRKLSTLEGEDGTACSEKLPASLEAGTIWEGRIAHKRRDGREYEVEASVSPVTDADGRVTHMVAVQRDVTTEVELQRRLQHVQKMETIGTLAGGIAHDFNNILMPILGYADLGLEDLPEDLPFRDDLKKIAQAAIRGTDLVAQILAFSRKGDPRRKPVSVAKVIEEALDLLAPTLPAECEVRREINAGSGIVLADATQIHQVVVNLCSNACQAMAPGLGTLTVRLEDVEVDETLADQATHLKPGDYVCLTIEDTGAGMDRATLERIFEPFFTTKPVGESMGLGLSVVHGVVMDHGGDLIVDSEPGRGTRIRVYLPSHAQPAEEESEPEDEDSRGRERILFVDDEVEIGRLAKRVLEKLGYSVTVEQRSTNAFVRFSQAPDAFDLLITDLMMPELSGAKLADKVLAIRPDLPIIAITGYSESLTPERAEMMGIRDYLLKPIRNSELGSAVRRALASDPVRRHE